MIPRGDGVDGTGEHRMAAKTPNRVSVLDMVQTAPVPPVHAPFTYRQKQHFVATLRRMQGRSATDIPTSVTDAVRVACVHEAAAASSITPSAVEHILRDPRRSDGSRFEDVHHRVYQVADTLRGTPPLRLTDAQEDELCDAFERVVRPYGIHRLAERVDSLQTEWVALRLLRLFRYPAHVVDQLTTPFLRSRDDVQFCRDTWARICADNGWHDDLVSDDGASETAGS